MESVTTVNPLDVCVLAYSPDECPGPLSGLEIVVWSYVLHVSGHGSSPV